MYSDIFNPEIVIEESLDSIVDSTVDNFHHTLTLFISKYDVELLRKYYIRGINNVSSQDAYIKLYFLLLYMYEQCGTYVDVPYSLMILALYGSKEGNYKRKLGMLLGKMEDEGLILIDKVDWAKSKLRKNVQTCYKYSVKKFDEIVLDQKDVEIRKEKYSKRGSIRFKYKIDKSFDGYINNNFINNIKFSVISNNFVCNELCNNSLSANSFKKCELSHLLSEIVHYIPDYSSIKLDIDRLLRNTVLTFKQRKELLSAARYWNKEPIIGSDNRIYHAFHRFPRTLREQCLTYKGSPIIEVSDIHNAYYVFMCKLLEKDKRINRYLDIFFELEKFEKLVMSGQFYETIRDYTIFTQPTGNPDTDAINKKNDREKVKQYLQSYRNEKPGRMKARFPEIDRWFDINYPAIREFLRDYPKQENGKKALQRDIASIETDIMTNICKELHDTYSVTPFPLHDAIFMSETDNAILKAHNVNIDSLLVKYLNLQYYKA